MAHPISVIRWWFLQMTWFQILSKVYSCILYSCRCYLHWHMVSNNQRISYFQITVCSHTLVYFSFSFFCIFFTLMAACQTLALRRVTVKIRVHDRVCILNTAVWNTAAGELKKFFEVKKLNKVYFYSHVYQLLPAFRPALYWILLRLSLHALG